MLHLCFTWSKTNASAASSHDIKQRHSFHFGPQGAPDSTKNKDPCSSFNSTATFFLHTPLKSSYQSEKVKVKRNQIWVMIDCDTVETVQADSTANKRFNEAKVGD